MHAGATGYGNPGFGKAFGNDANGPFALLEPGPGLIIEKFRPEGQQIERAFREAVKAKTGSDVLAGGHQLAGGGLWVLKLVLDAAKTDDLDKFRAAVMSLDLPVGSAVNGWGVKFDETGQNSNARVQHYMLQWQNGSARHRVARGVHDQPRQVDSARRLGPAEVAGPGAGRADLRPSTPRDRPRGVAPVAAA